MRRNPSGTQWAGIALVGGAAIFALVKMLGPKPDIPQDLKIVSYKNNRTGITKLAGEKLQCLVGDIIETTVQFTYFGKAFNAKYHLATFCKTMNTENEVTMVEQNFSVPSTPDKITITGVIPMTLTQPSSLEMEGDSTYGLYCKVEGITTNISTLEKVIFLKTEGTWDDKITDLHIMGITYSNPVYVGANCRVVVGYTYVGEEHELDLWSGIGNEDAFGFHYFTSGTRSVIISQSDIEHFETQYVDVPINQSSGSPFDIRIEFGSKIVTIYDKLNVISGNPTVTVDKSSVAQGDSITFSFSGFQPNSKVTIFWDGSFDVMSDAAGNGSATVIVNAPVGESGVLVSDLYDHDAYVAFTITARVPEVVSFSVGMANLTGQTHYACWYYDYYTQKFVNGGTHPVYEYTNFSAHNDGYITLQYSSDNGSTWTDWINSPYFIPKENILYFYDVTNSKYVDIYGNPI
jgi:hypothetical protein